MQVTVNKLKLKHIASHRRQASQIAISGTFFTEFFFSVSNEVAVVLATRTLSKNLEKHKQKTLTILFKNMDENEKKLER